MKKTKGESEMDWTKKYKKAVTFSYDDGVTPDVKLIEIFNKYGMKCTFNLNSGLGAESDGWDFMGKYVNRLDLKKNKELYAGHEVAAHGLTHLNLMVLVPEDAKRQMTEDIKGLTEIFGTKPVGMAYPYGTYNDSVVEMLDSIGMKYGRTVWSSHNFDVQEDLLRFRPTCHHDDEKLFELAEEFLAMETEEPKIFYIWGHSYEFEGNENWDRIEKLCRMLAGREDIFYGTNAEVLLPVL